MRTECDWVEPISFTLAEIDPLVDCCERIAEQIWQHNKLFDEFCT